MLYLQGKDKVFLLMIEPIERDVLYEDILAQRISTINIRYRRNRPTHLLSHSLKMSARHLFYALPCVTQTIHYVRQHKRY